jgi:hypothetical protein
MRRVTRLQANLRTVFKLVHPYVAKGSGMPFDKTTLEAIPLFVVRREDETLLQGLMFSHRQRRGDFGVNSSGCSQKSSTIYATPRSMQ